MYLRESPVFIIKFLCAPMVIPQERFDCGSEVMKSPIIIDYDTDMVIYLGIHDTRPCQNAIK